MAFQRLRSIGPARCCAARLCMRSLLVAAQIICAAAAFAAGPEVHSFFPAGGQRGTTVEVTVGGKLPSWPVQTWVDGAGLTLTSQEEKGKLSIAIAAEAVPGTRWIRVHDAAGASAPVPFIIGSFARDGRIGTERRSDDRVDSGRRAAWWQTVAWESPATSTSGRSTCGKGKPWWRRSWRTKGSARRSTRSCRSSPPVARSWPSTTTSADWILKSPLSLRPTARYLVRVFGFPSKPNQTIGFAGGESYVYRLTLATGPFVDYGWPLAVTRGPRVAGGVGRMEHCGRPANAHARRPGRSVTRDRSRGWPTPPACAWSRTRLSSRPNRTRPIRRNRSRYPCRSPGESRRPATSMLTPLPASKASRWCLSSPVVGLVTRWTRCCKCRCRGQVARAGRRPGRSSRSVVDLYPGRRRHVSAGGAGPEHGRQHAARLSAASRPGRTGVSGHGERQTRSRSRPISRPKSRSRSIGSTGLPRRSVFESRVCRSSCPPRRWFQPPAAIRPRRSS